MSANMSRWDPLREMETLMGRMAPAALSRWPFFAPETQPSAQFDWTPSVDISETDKEFVIRASLPAVKKEDIHVSVADGMVTLQGERKQERKEEGEKFHRVESYYGRFMRSFSIPKNANADAIRCESKDGVLTVHLPKSAVKTPQEKKITVE